MGFFRDLFVRIRGNTADLDAKIEQTDSIINRLRTKINQEDLRVKTIATTSFALMSATLSNLSRVSEINEAVIAQQVAASAIAIAQISAQAIANFGNPLGFVYGALALQMSATQSKAIQQQVRAQQINEYVNNINLYTINYGGSLL